MDKAELKRVLDAHRKWLRGEDGGARADLTDANLRGADLTGAVLTDAVLTDADLRGANLTDANLRDAVLTDAVLTDANLRGADLRDADLTGAVLTDAVLTDADLRGANLTDANLRDADLTGAVLTDADLTDANLRGADLRDADLTGANIYYPMSCPSEGAFIGWKKARNIDDGTSCIVKLMIYDDARRSSATGRKCRCDKVKVLTVYDMHGNEITANVCSIRYRSFRYVVGATIIVKDFDENRWNECSTGIHFFITREEAERYIG